MSKISFDLKGLTLEEVHLFNAAKDMLTALTLAQATIERLQRHAPGSAVGTLDVIKAAVRKAEGL